VQTFNLSREGQITDRFTKAIEQIGALDGSGNLKLEVRLGGIYALERIARDSERDQWVIVEVLSTYVRVHSPRKRGIDKDSTIASEALAAATVSSDFQAILTVLGRREAKYDKGYLDLTNTNLPKARFEYAKLRNAEVWGTNLHGASFNGADLRKASLFDANLTSAYLVGADLRGSDLDRDSFTGADLDDADLRDANLIGADLTGAHLVDANLGKAKLTYANLKGANLENAKLSGADISKADLRMAVNLTQDQINSASGDSATQLPANLTRPGKWPR